MEFVLEYNLHDFFLSSVSYIFQVLTDTHPKVQAAGQTALQQVMLAYFS